jgi:hypothetical protein
MIEVTQLLPTLHINKSIITLEAVLQQTGNCYFVASIPHTAKSWGSMNPAIIIPKTEKWWAVLNSLLQTQAFILFCLIQSESASILLMCLFYSLFKISC